MARELPEAIKHFTITSQRDLTMKMCMILLPLLLGLCQFVTASDGITFRISSGTVAIATNDVVGEKFRDDGMQGEDVLVICKRLQITFDANSYSVACDDVRVITAGSEFTARHATFDLKSGQFVLNDRMGVKLSPRLDQACGTKPDELDRQERLARGPIRCGSALIATFDLKSGQFVLSDPVRCGSALIDSSGEEGDASKGETTHE
jgi:hypothetical protein